MSKSAGGVSNIEILVDRLEQLLPRVNSPILKSKIGEAVTYHKLVASRSFVKDVYTDQVKAAQDLVDHAERDTSSYSTQVGATASQVGRDQGGTTRPFAGGLGGLTSENDVRRIGGGAGTPEQLPASALADEQMAAQLKKQIGELREALTKSADPLERDRISNDLTRAQLTLHHMGA